MLESLQTNDYSFNDYVQLNDKLLFIDYYLYNNQYEIKTTDPMTAYRYQGNLFGLFKEMGISQKQYVYVMYANGYTNPLNYEGKKIQFKVPVNPPEL